MLEYTDGGRLSAPDQDDRRNAEKDGDLDGASRLYEAIGHLIVGERPWAVRLALRDLWAAFMSRHASLTEIDQELALVRDYTISDIEYLASQANVPALSEAFERAEKKRVHV
jgi:hypothetical protein